MDRENKVSKISFMGSGTILFTWNGYKFPMHLESKMSPFKESLLTDC